MSRKTNRPTCILLTGPNEFLRRSAVLLISQYLDILRVVSGAQSVPDEAELADLNPDFVFSFLSERILRGALITPRTVNFHPAPPEWPGRGGASYALFNGDRSYGATAHIIDAGIDSGPILSVNRFDIVDGETCESIFLRAELECLHLLQTITAHIHEHGQLMPPSGDSWKRKAGKKKDLDAWLLLDLENPEEFEAKIQAAKHSRFEGPYVMIHGRKFALDRSERPAEPDVSV